MTRTTLLVICAWFATAGPAVAALAFLGMRAEVVDSFAVGLLEPLPAGSTIRFRDDEWDGTSFNEGSPADTFLSFGLDSSLPAGTILHFTHVGDSGPLTVTDGFGTPVSGTVGGDGVLRLSTSNEGIYAYLGPTFDVVETPLASLRTGTAGGTLFGISADFTGVEDTFGNQAGNSLVYSGPLSVDGPYSLFEDLVSNPDNWSVLDSPDPNNQLSTYTPPQGLLQAVSAVPEPGAVIWSLFAVVSLVRSTEPRRPRS